MYWKKISSGTRHEDNSSWIFCMSLKGTRLKYPLENIAFWALYFPIFEFRSKTFNAGRCISDFLCYGINIFSYQNLPFVFLWGVRWVFFLFPLMRSYHNNYPELSVINSSFAGRFLDASSTSVVEAEINGGFLLLQPAEKHTNILKDWTQGRRRWW